MHALINNGMVEIYPYSIGQLRKDNPNTSFPKNVSDETLQTFKVFRVFFSTPPEVTEFQVLEEGTPVFDQEAGRWTQVFVVRDMSEEEVAQVTASKAEQIRNERNSLLVASDWTQVLDAPVDQTAWAEYRQALRDITSQEGFPHNVVWPTKPV
jgi:hypothetical protein